jgi:DHA3 family macrolide efflux protein-like MFS transporter
MAAFFTIWTGQAISLLGSQLVQFALIWWLTETTGSATVLAGASMIGLLPQIALGPVAGALVDRWNRRRVMLIADGAIALATVGLALLFWTGVAQVWHVLVLLFIRALGSLFHWVAMQATTPLMVAEKHLTRVAGMNQTLYGGLTVVAGPLGALLLAALPMQGILAIDVVSALFAIGPLLFIAVPQPPVEAERGASVLDDLRSGMRYVRDWPGMLLLMGIFALVNLMTQPAFTLLPILVTRHFGGGALQLGWLEATCGVGFILGGLLLSTWGGFKRRIVTLLVALAGAAVGALLIGLTPASLFPMAVGAMLIVGLAIPAIDGPLMAIVQASAAPEMQGRVLTLVLSAAKIMTVVSLPIAGPLADLLGVRTWYVAGGVACAVMALVGLLTPALLNIEEWRDAERRDEETDAGMPPAAVEEPARA